MTISVNEVDHIIPFNLFIPQWSLFISFLVPSFFDWNYDILAIKDNYKKTFELECVHFSQLLSTLRKTCIISSMYSNVVQIGLQTTE